MTKFLFRTALAIAALFFVGFGAVEAQQRDTTTADSVARRPVVVVAGDTVPGDSLPARPPLSASADSVLRALRQLQGYTVTEYLGETANYRADDGVLRLVGEAEVVREGDRLTADTIVYLDREDRVVASGRPRVLGQDQDLQAEILYYDLATRRATAVDAETQITSDATWFVRGGNVTLEGTDRLYGSHARFTSCDLTTPHYHFEADRVMVIRGRILVARPARLYFGDVPVMVLPFVVQNLEEGRRSGFLTPRFGVHDIVRTSSGYNRQVSDVGFYWAVNQYAGAQVSTTWRSGAYTALLGNVDFNLRRQFLNGTFGVERYWRAEGGKELSVNARSSWQPDERTNMALSGRYVSSTDFVRDASYDPREVTQDLNSSFSLSRRFNWGSTSLGAERRQSIPTGDVSMTLPSFSISLPSMTFFSPTGGGDPRWYNNATFTPGGISGSRSTNDYTAISRTRRDQDETRFSVGPSLSIGNLTLSTSALLNRSEIRAGALSETPGGAPISLAGFTSDEATWSSSISYQQRLIGSTSISPNVSLNQQLVRDTATAEKFLAAPMRVSVGTSLNTDLYGFYPGVANFSAIRHRLSPRFSYSYAPEVEQTDLQVRVFGEAGGRAQNRISFGINQTWEAKLRDAPRPQQPLPRDSLSGDSIPVAQTPSVPTDPTKVVLLSLTTSALEYDFEQKAAVGTGFVTQQVSNSITSDYLRGLNIQIQHDLFDRSMLDPGEAGTVGKLGTFAPRLSSMSTSFQLGPESTLVQWLQRLGGTSRRGSSEDDGGVLPGPPESDQPVPAGQGSFTGNSQGTGSGPWNASIGYQYSRPARFFSEVELDDEAVQTLDGNMSFQLSPNWGVNWATSYSITDRKFGSHRINFQRDLHEWQANFNFYQTPNGNTAFEFFVELTHNRDIRFDYSEADLGVDRNR